MRDAPCKPGDRIELTDMPKDPNPIPAGTTGTVLLCATSAIPDRFQILVDWDIPRSLALVWPTDSFKVLEPAHV